MDLSQPGSYTVTATRIVPEAAYRFEFGPDGKVDVVPLKRPHAVRNEKLRSANVVIDIAKAKAGAAPEMRLPTNPSATSGSPPEPTRSVVQSSAAGSYAPASLSRQPPNLPAGNPAEHSSMEADPKNDPDLDRRTTSESDPDGRLSPGKRIAGGITVALLAFLVAVVCRGALRKRIG
jgi:hypothetical protein